MRSLALIAAFGLLASGEPEPLELMGRFDPDQIPEASGIAASLRHPGIYWVHNDSGNPPLLFAIQRDGRIQHTVRLQIPNLDWEDIALDDLGRIALGDVGNNQGLMPIRVIHRFPEPDLAGDPERLLRPSESVHYRYPADDRFDAEALVVEGELAVVIAKRRDGREAELFGIRCDPPAPLLRPAVAELLGRVPGFVEPVTGAALSSNGRLLAVCSTTVTRVYDRQGRGDWNLRPRSEVRYPAIPVEGITWDQGDLLLVSEGRGIDRIRESRWRRGRRPDWADPPAPPH